MNKRFTIYFSLAIVLFAFGFTKQTQPVAAIWTAAELTAANTGANSKFLKQIEKDALKYINLARLYPKRFVEVELKIYFGTVENPDYLKNSTFRKSLITTLNKGKTETALLPDSTLTKTAECLGKEQEKSGKVGHDRKKCKADYYSECVSYGMSNGLDVAMQLLIDHTVSSLGHRKTCLSDDYKKVGLSHNKHKTQGTAMVLDFK